MADNPTVMLGDRVDSLTATFGAHGHQLPDDVLDLRLGLMRGFRDLDAIWSSIDLAGTPWDVGSYPGTQGSLELLQCLAELINREHGVQVSVSSLVATHGAFDAIAHALAGQERGRPVLYPMPGFDISAPVCRAGCRPEPLPTPVRAGMPGLLDRVATRIRTRPPAAMVITVPSNPAGDVPSRDEWRDLLSMTVEQGVLLVIDLVYNFLGPGCPAWVIEHPDVVLVDSLSKRLGAPGLRLGWVSCAPGRTGAVRASAATTSVGISNLVGAVATRALREYLERDAARSIAVELTVRRRTLHESTASRLRSCLVLPPTSIYACLRLPADGSGVRAAEHLASRGVLVTPLASQGIPLDTRALLRLCLGADSRMAAVASAFNEELA